ncbi:tetratricopeptide repeat protein 7A-like [Clytia hemisphaerica]|uniref:Tetratricopeptide repeat protein 7 N-terminal domain-containing protein n=1 Tax=Clytia hemisphaerica TaxID=252671 RepID=A0A7M5XCS8_9CNID
MSKKLANEKEIERNRLEKKWKGVIQLVSALNVKNAGGASSSEEIELFSCFYLGEAELEKTIEETFKKHGNFLHLKIQSEALKQAYSYLSAALTAAKKAKNKYPRLLQDTVLLLSKYHFVIGDYDNCLMYIRSMEDISLEGMPRRSKCIFSEAFACKAIALELQGDATIDEMNKDAIQAYERAGEIALAICIEEEKQGSMKRNVSTATSSHTTLSKLMEFAMLRPGHMFAESGMVDDAIQNYRALLKIIETKATANTRKMACRYLAQILLSCSCSQLYTPPSSMSDSISRSNSNTVTMMSTPRKDSPDLFANNSLKRNTLTDSMFCPQDEVEETLLVLLIAEALHLQQSEVKHTEEDSVSKERVLNETNMIYDSNLY